MRSLYICYFGVSEPLVNTQVIPYLRELVRAGHTIHLLTFEPQSSRVHDPEFAAVKTQELSTQGITWHWRTYHKGGLTAKLTDFLSGTWNILRIARVNKINLLHARSQVAMSMAMVASWFHRAKILFDIRGLQAEEYVDAGIWSSASFGYRITKWIEHKGIRRADHIVVLTELFKRYLVEHESVSPENITVVPCCVDVNKFVEAAKQSTPTKPFTAVYAGTITGLYLLPEMAAFVMAVRQRIPQTFFQILSGSPTAPAQQILHSTGFSDDQFKIERVSPDEVASHEAEAKVGLCFLKPSFSKIACSPTKIAEYLAAGVPVVCTAGAGDTDAIITNNRVGIVLNDLSSEGMKKCVDDLLRLLNEPDLRGRCQKVARDYFDMQEIGGKRYASAYHALEEK